MLPDLEMEEVMSCQSLAETHCDVAPAISRCSVPGITARSSALGCVRRLLGTCF